MVLEFQFKGGGNGVRSLHGRLSVHRYIDLGHQPMPQPARSGIEYGVESGNVGGHMMNFFNDLGIDPVEHPREHGFGRLPDNPEDGDCDQEANDWIGERESQPDSGCPATTARLVNPSVRAW